MNTALTKVDHLEVLLVHAKITSFFHTGHFLPLVCTEILLNSGKILDG
jgi:hypothetical protein